MIRFLCVFVALVFPLSAMAGAWDSTYEGAAGVHGPITSSTSVALAPDHMRNARQEIRYRLEVEHFVGDGDGTADDNGLHRIGSARCFMSDDPPDELDDSHSAATDTIYDYLNSTGASDSGIEDLEDSASNSAGGAEDDVGHGRCWIDTNDGYKMYVFLGEAGDNTPSTVSDGWVPVSQLGGGNMLVNGGFEATDGDGDSSSTTLPTQWTTRGTATYSYAATDVTEGDGLELNMATSAVDSGLIQVLTGLKSSTWYTFEVRAKSATGKTCQLRVEGTIGDAIPTAQEVETASTSYTTLKLWVKTDSTPNDLTYVLQEESGSSGDCSWDHARAVEQTRVSGQKEVAYFSDYQTGLSTTCTTSYGSGCTAAATVKITPPGPGYILQLVGKVDVNPTSGSYCEARIYDSDVLGAVVTKEDPDAGGNPQLLTMHVNNVVVNPTPGTETTYVIQVRTTGSDNCNLAGDASLDALLIPIGG